MVVRFFTSAIIFFNFSHLLTTHGRRRCNLFQNFRIGPSLFESNQIRRTRIRMSKFLRAQAKTHRTRSEIAKKTDQQEPLRIIYHYLRFIFLRNFHLQQLTASHHASRLQRAKKFPSTPSFLLIKILSCCRLHLVNCTLRTSAAPMNHISV